MAVGHCAARNTQGPTLLATLERTHLNRSTIATLSSLERLSLLRCGLPWYPASTIFNFLLRFLGPRSIVSAVKTYQVVQRVQSLLSGQGHHQTQGHLEVQASPLSLSHLQEREKNLLSGLVGSKLAEKLFLISRKQAQGLDCWCF